MAGAQPLLFICIALAVAIQKPQWVVVPAGYIQICGRSVVVELGKVAHIVMQDIPTG